MKEHSNAADSGVYSVLTFPGRMIPDYPLQPCGLISPHPTYLTLFHNHPAGALLTLQMLCLVFTIWCPLLEREPHESWDLLFAYFYLKDLEQCLTDRSQATHILQHLSQFSLIKSTSSPGVGTP